MNKLRMNCQISCSVGEAIDKASILRIKLKQSASKKDVAAIAHITKSLDTILKEVPLLHTHSDLSEELQKTNSRIWILRDVVRHRASLNNDTYDPVFHRSVKSLVELEDKREQLKEKINQRYDSTLRDVKIFKYGGDVSSPSQEQDQQLLDQAKQDYTEGRFTDSVTKLSSLMKKHTNNTKHDQFMVELLFSYGVAENVMKTKIDNDEFNVYARCQDIMHNLYSLNIPSELQNYCNNAYVMMCLEERDYKEARNYLCYLNSITGPGVTPETSCFFEEGDQNKTLLLYDGGGIGDKIMFSRFLPEVCNKFRDNKVVLFLDSYICWMMEAIMHQHPNFKVVSYDEPTKLPAFDYHCNMLSLVKYLNYTYETIPYQPMLINMRYEKTRESVELLGEIHETLTDCPKPVCLLNWRGNPKNGHELTNRRMELQNAIPLFEYKNVQWIVVTQDITPDEQKILDKYKVLSYGDILDKDKTKCFYDTIDVLKLCVHYIFSTDTSILHLGANLGIPSYGLLTKGCEWRWTKSSRTTWYPDVKLLRQSETGNWKNVIEKVISELNRMHISP